MLRHSQHLEDEEMECMCAKSLQSCLTLLSLWTVARQAPLSMGFSRQEYWSGLPIPSPGDLPNPGIKPDSLPLSHQGSPQGDGEELAKETEIEQLGRRWSQERAMSWKPRENVSRGRDSELWNVGDRSTKMRAKNWLLDLTMGRSLMTLIKPLLGEWWKWEPYWNRWKKNVQRGIRVSK